MQINAHFKNIYDLTGVDFAEEIIKYIVVALIWVFGIMMIKLYAPADTEDVPILSKKVRKQKRTEKQYKSSGTQSPFY